jgi:hypothetical protein
MQQKPKSKRTQLTVLEIIVSALFLLYGAGAFFLAHMLDDMGMITVIIRQVQAVGIGLGFIALTGFLGARQTLARLQVLVALAWLGLIPLARQLDVVMFNDGWSGFTPWAVGIAACLASLHFFFARHLRYREVS